MNADTSKTRFDETEPKALPKAAPIVVFMVLAVALYWGSLFLNNNAGGFNAQVYRPFSSSEALRIAQPTTDVPIEFTRGKALYATACAPCHQANGQGLAGTAPPLAGSEWVLTPNPGRMMRIGFNGLTGPVTVKGTEWNLQMPAMGQQLALSDEDYAALLTFIRMNKEWGHSLSAVKPEDVKAARGEIDGRSTQWTVEELQQIPEK